MKLTHLGLGLAFAGTMASATVPPPPHERRSPTGSLHNGVIIPLVGLGCASGVREDHVKNSLSLGYRFLDAAQSYNWGYHEDEIGSAILRSGIERGEIFVQTKVHPEDLGFEATKRAVQTSLERLGVSHIDSVLIHKPHCWEGACSKPPEGTWQDSWRALEELYDAGVIGAIGICDVDSRLLEELLRQRIKPHIIQNWMDPIHQDKRMRESIISEGIQYQAYSTLGSQWVHHQGHQKNPVLLNPILVSIAKSHNVDVAQVIINWATRHGVSVLPASTNSTRQAKNLISYYFDLTDDEMRLIDNIDGEVPEKGTEEVDQSEVSIRFQNKSKSVIDAYWVDHSNKEVHVGSIDADGALSLTAYHGHKFRFRDGNSALKKEQVVYRKTGEEQVHEIHSEF